MFVGYLPAIFRLPGLSIPTFSNAVLSVTAIITEVTPSLISSACKHSHVWMPHELERNACSWEFAEKVLEKCEKYWKSRKF